jgi:hypothetical protein
VWNDPSSGSVNDRARLWLDINCAHCHQHNGPASTSGLFLGSAETDLLKIGVRKTPVAAGRGSGDLQFGILPGQPDKSILVYRMESKDPGVMMPDWVEALLISHYPDPAMDQGNEMKPTRSIFFHIFI